LKFEVEKMESGRLYFDSSACRGNNMNMLFLGNADLGFRGIFLNLLSFYGTILFFWIVNCWCCCLVWFGLLRMVFVWMVGGTRETHTQLRSSGSDPSEGVQYNNIDFMS